MRNRNHKPATARKNSLTVFGIYDFEKTLAISSEMVAVRLQLRVEFSFLYARLIERNLLLIPLWTLPIQGWENMGNECVRVVVVRDNYPGQLVGQISILPNLFERRVIVQRLDKGIVSLLRYNALLQATSIRQPNEFIGKVVKLPKDSCEVRTKHNHVFLKTVAVSLRHLL